MHDLLLHELGARRITWRYDDPSGVPDLPARRGGRPVLAASELRAAARRRLTPKEA